MTKEHVFANWMRNYLPDFYEGSSHVVREFKYEGRQVSLDYIKAGLLNRVGDHRSQKLRVVCSSCNGGWMSQIQQKTKPVLAPMLIGEWGFLDRKMQEILASWATMFTMVYEMAHPGTAATGSTEKETFWKTKRPPDNWLVWVGCYQPDLANATPIHHRGILLANKPVSSKKKNTQMTGVGVARVFFYTFSHNESLIDELQLSSIRRCAETYGLRQIWPTTEGNIFVPSKPELAMQHQIMFEIVDEMTTMLLQGSNPYRVASSYSYNIEEFSYKNFEI